MYFSSLIDPSHKQFTAAAVLTLVQDGRVGLDEPIKRYLSDAPIQGRAVTVRQLLSHTAGIPDYAESPRIASLKRLDLPPDSLVALVATTPFYFEPGEQMRYSNTNYALLGQLIERVSGQPYAAYVEQRVLRPAGAAHAHFCDLEALVKHPARGYTATPDGLRPATYLSPHLPYAAGGFCGTVGDLAAWNAALHARRGGPVLAPELYAEMVKPGTVAGGRRTRYGFGVALSDIGGRPAVHHGGDIDGFTTFTAYLPADSLNLDGVLSTPKVRPDRTPSRRRGRGDRHLQVRPPACPPGAPRGHAGLRDAGQKGRESGASGGGLRCRRCPTRGGTRLRRRQVEPAAAIVHVLIWWDEGRRLSSAARRGNRGCRQRVRECRVRREAAMKIGLGRLRPARTVEEAAQESGFLELPITFRHAQPGVRSSGAPSRSRSTVSSSPRPRWKA